MRKLVFITGVFFLLTILVVGTVSAALPGSGWWSALFAQNVEYGSIDESLSMTAYEPGASATTYSSLNYLFDFGQSLVYDPGKSPNYSTGGNVIGFEGGLPGGFEGSVVLSSSVPLVAVSEIANYNNGPVGSSGTASAFYQAMSAEMAKNELRVTTVKHNYGKPGQTTTIYVQAVSGDAHVTVTYNMNDGGVYSQTEDITQNKMFVFDPANANVPSENCGYDANASPCFGTAIIVSTTGTIAANYVEHPHQGSPAYLALSARAQTIDDQSYILYGPSVKHRYTTNAGTGVTGDAIMNVGTSTAKVRITLTVTKLGQNAPSGVNVGDVFTDIEYIEPGKSVVFSQWDNNLGGMPAGTYAAAVYESIYDADHGITPQPLIGASNDAKTMRPIPGGKGKTVYQLFSSDSVTGTVAVPMITEFENNLTGALTVQNVGTEDTIIHFIYYEYGSTNSFHFWTANALKVGEAVNSWGVSRNSGNYFENDGTWDWSELYGKQFSAIIYSESGGPINCVVFENAPSSNVDIRNYEGFNITQTMP